MDQEKNNGGFKPYISANQVVPELTVRALVLGAILAVVFGAANAYLGLRAGTTISASIPAAVISMAVFQIVLKKSSILESAISETTGSAGESVAAGIIFTIPALYIWAKEGIMDPPSTITIILVAAIGGIVGILFMIPLRDALIVKEHNVLPYPEGTACSKVLLTGEDGATSKSVFLGIGISMVLKFVLDGVKAFTNTIVVGIDGLKTQLSVSVSPSLLGVGYICGPEVGAKMMAGGLLSWFVLIPAISFFGADSVVAPASVPISEIYAQGGAQAIWDNYIRYIGSGAVAAAGIISLAKTMPLIIKTLSGVIGNLRQVGGGDRSVRTEKNLDLRIIGILLAVCILVIWLVPAIPVGLGGALAILVFGFLFATVSSRMVGLVGSSNNPISGMTIATLLFLCLFYKASGNTGPDGMTSVIIIAGIICVISAIAGDLSQDLKCGYLLGSTPRNQQIGEMVGAIVTALSIGGIIYLMDQAWGFGSKELPAPQATLMKVIVEGLMGGKLPWTLVFIGIFLSVAIEFLGVSSLTVAIGVYLPVETSAAILLGGLVRYLVEFIQKKQGVKNPAEASEGVLFSSGLIAGEGLIGVLLAVLAVLGLDSKIALGTELIPGYIDEIVLLLALMTGIALVSLKGTSKKGATGK